LVNRKSRCDVIRSHIELKIRCELSSVRVQVPAAARVRDMDNYTVKDTGSSVKGMPSGWLKAVLRLSTMLSKKTERCQEAMGKL
jgi:hypothetical protein